VSEASERIAWVVETLDVQPDDRLLEVGCGHGVAVSLVCTRLSGGHITAIDRSPKMIAAATRRNADCVTARRASFQTVSLSDADFGETEFDKVLAIHFPPFLRGDPARELRLVADHLAPDGRLYVASQPLDAAKATQEADAVSSSLEAHGFVVDRVVTGEPAGAPAFCAVALALRRSA
jgi:cyclopropane fatty-acyl-phospholipid synthase-like methyltransferase